MSDIHKDNQNAEANKRQKGDPRKISTSIEAPSAIKQFENESLGITKASPSKDQYNQNFLKNVGSFPRRGYPAKDYKLIQKVEEKVVQEKSIRTGSPRHRRATLLHFAPTKELPDVARVQLLLSNISERPLQFKLKSEPGPDISALPSAKGHIDAHGSAKCILTWRREANVDKWSNAQQPKMLLVLDFLHDKAKDEKHTLTRLIGKVVSGQVCDSDKPPIEQLMLDAATNEYSRLISRELLLLEQAHTPKNEPEEEKNESKLEDIMNSITDWLNQQSKDSLLVLLILIIFFYFLGLISSFKQKEHDE
ncbi:Protein Ycf2 [Dirofilaria immitis]